MLTSIKNISAGKRSETSAILYPAKNTPIIYAKAIETMPAFISFLTELNIIAVIKATRDKTSSDIRSD